jgi:hypothetical protein|tara:strand:- start:2170 stop:2349 length:180 start_codon:yes stop_codon:yes gene_type:complete
MSEKPIKQWQKIKVFNTYEEAAALKTELMTEAGLEVKIRRCGPEGTQFKVKTHRPKTNK